MLCLLQPTANYDLAIIGDYLAGNEKIKISIKKQNGVVVIFGEPWQLLLTGSAVPRILTCVGLQSQKNPTQFKTYPNEQQRLS